MSRSMGAAPPPYERSLSRLWPPLSYSVLFPVRLVHVSTVLAYGRPKGSGLTPETAFDESATPGPTTSRYAESKQAGDKFVRAALRTAGLDGCICYLACCIGADPKLLNPMRECAASEQ